MSGERARPTARFTSRVDDYVRSRPGYPPELIPLLAREIGLAPSWKVADIGSGTGISAEPFLEFGNRVVGVEPNEAMRRAAEARFGGRSSFRSVEGRAEATGLAGESVELVMAAQAFHWFDPPRSRLEFRRILKPGGWVALVWNTRRTEGTPFLRAYEELLLRHGTDYGAVRHDRAGGRSLDVLFPHGFARHFLRNAQVLDREGLVARLRSSSYTPPSNDARYPAMLAAADRIFDEHATDRTVEIAYDTEIFLGRP